ncbi:hypothetical protein [Ruegeria atlantica]|nr:hypothetical protein [Ruegeria atlantica]
MTATLSQPRARQKQEPWLWIAKKMGFDYSAFPEGASEPGSSQRQKTL